MRRPILGSDVRQGADRLPRQIPPIDGEIVLSCGHGTPSPMLTAPDDPRNATGWWELRPPAVIAGPTGQLESRWISCCAACLRAAGGDPRRVQIRAHFAFAGVASSDVVDIARTSR